MRCTGTSKRGWWTTHAYSYTHNFTIIGTVILSSQCLVLRYLEQAIKEWNPSSLDSVTKRKMTTRRTGNGPENDWLWLCHIIVFPSFCHYNHNTIVVSYNIFFVAMMFKKLTSKVNNSLHTALDFERKSFDS